MTCWKLLVAGVVVGAGFCALAGCGSLGSGSFLVPDVDSDGDGVLDAFDVAPADSRACTDGDDDGCDDCSLRDEVDPDNDGWDAGGDGACEMPLDWDCMHGEGAATDPWRPEACVMLALANADRALFVDEAGGAPPLVWSEEIHRVALAHSKDMCERGYFDHFTPEGLDPSGRGEQAGLDYPLAENISLNLDPRAAAYGFMLEPTCRGHRGILLDTKAVALGVGYYVCDNRTSPFGAYHYVTQNFRYDFSIPTAGYCVSPVTDCEVPPDPPTTAVCPADLDELGFCPPPDDGILTTWSCPAD